MRKTDWVYFMYSDEQVKEKNDVLKVSGKKFVCGTVVVNGQRQKFSQIATSKSVMDRFIDTYVVTEGVYGDITYIDPSTELL